MPPLVKAAFDGDFEKVRKLLNDGADIQSRDNALALNWAARRGWYNIVELLIMSGADVNPLVDAKMTPLIDAAIGGDANIVRLLIQQGAYATKDLQTSKGDTALHLAVSWSNVDVVRALLEAGADINIRANDGKLPIELANARDGRDKMDKILEIFKQHQASPKAR